MQLLILFFKSCIYNLNSSLKAKIDKVRNITTNLALFLSFYKKGASY